MLRAIRAGSTAALGIIVFTTYIPARADGDLYQLVGKIRQEDGKVFRDVTPVVFLFSNATPFSTQALADPSGHFKIRAVPPGPYTISIAVEHGGELTQSVDIGPSFADKKRRIVRDFLFRRKPPGSSAHLISALELSIPSNARAEYQKSQNRLSKRDVEGAIQHLKKAVKIAPQFSEAWNSLGTIAYQSRNLGEAENFFREALKHSPTSFHPLVNLGGTLLSRGKHEEALLLNRLAAQSRPNDPLAQSQLGQNYFQLGQLDLAEQHLKLARALDQSHFTYPQLVLADIYQRRNDFPSLVRELEEFLTLHPDSKRVPDVRRLLEYARSHARERLPSK